MKDSHFDRPTSSSGGRFTPVKRAFALSNTGKTPENADLAPCTGAPRQALVASAPKTGRRLRRRHKGIQSEATVAGHQARR